MPRDGNATRERILDAAETLILDRGFAGMTVDQLLAAVGVTKGAFFYHFKSKDDLARVLIGRFAARDRQTYEEVSARAEKLADDPLQQILLFVRLFEEMFDGLTKPYPGCLFASYVYELEQFDPGTHELIRESFVMWRSLLSEKFRAVAALYTPRKELDPDALADAFTVVIEGAFITAKAMNEPGVVVGQLRQYRNYLELLFASDPGR